MTAAPAAQNNNKWADPYQKGLKAFNAKNYRIAINFFEQAVAAEPRSGANKRVEGVFYTDYFPYYYLGVAHLELRQYEKAQENFDKARNGLTRQSLYPPVRARDSRGTAFRQRLARYMIRILGHETRGVA